MKKFSKSLMLLVFAAVSLGTISAASFVGKRDAVLAEDEDYYSEVDTSTRQKLMSTLTYRLNYQTKTNSYDSLWTAYHTTDVKPGTNYIWDMYSDCNYVVGGSKQGANYNKEGDSYNREHTVPQAWFDKKSPMVSDLFHIYPTDGWVNNKRSNYPHGEVGSATYTSENGSKLGSSSFSGISGTVFEPVDDYKGDFARTYFYMATRYAEKVGSWDGGVFSSSFPYMDSDFINLYIKWHEQDPVSDKEINRNDAAYLIQNNRNPFIDHPEWAEYIFKGTQPTPTKKLIDLTYTGTPVKTEYTEGDSFNPDGLVVTAKFDDNTTSNVTNSLTWSKLNVGDTSVTGTYTFDGVTKSITVPNITVNEKIIHVTGVTLNKNNLQLEIGSTGTLTPTIAPSDATNKNVSWKSSNSSIASVNNGVVTAIAAGSVTITVTTEDGGHTATCNITVMTSTETAIAEAKTWAISFISQTTTKSTCKASNDEARLSGLKTVWPDLESGYVALSSDAKTAFCTSSDVKIKEALNHYQFIISKFNKNGTELNDFVVDGNGNHPALSSRSLLKTMFSAENSGFIVAILSIIGVASIAVFVVYKRRKTY